MIERGIVNTVMQNITDNVPVFEMFVNVHSSAICCMYNL